MQKSLVRWHCLLIAAALIALVLAFSLSIGGRSLHAEAGRQETLLLRLRYATFDPTLGAPIQAASDLVPAPTSGRHPYIVQFIGPIEKAWTDRIVALGTQVVEYIPDYAYIVLTDAEYLPQLQSLPFVRWVGYLQPVYRIEPGLANGQGIVTTTISLFPGSVPTAASAAIVANGGTILPAGSSVTSLRAVITADVLPALAALPSVAWIEAYREPRLWNEVARGITGVSPVWTSHDLYGQGQIIAIADTGLDVGNTVTLAADFRGRLVAAYSWGRNGDWSDPDGHGTHVAGSAVGNGINSGSDPDNHNYGPSHAGVAPEAGLVVQSIMDEHGRLGGIPPDVGLLLHQAYDAGARIHSNSWGVSVDDGGRVYDSQAQQVDRFIWQHRDMVVLFAAGNDGRDQNRDGVVDLGSVTTPATAKNVISVGASESVRLSGGYNAPWACATWGDCWPDSFPVPPLRTDRLSDHPDGMAAFSSRGPTPDGRMKPDLVAPGTNIVSTRSALAPAAHYWGTYDDYYAYSGGTSTSTPLVAGAAALVRQYYETIEHHTPSAALVKATLLAGARDLTPGQFSGQQEVPPAPNNVEGWGRLDVTEALFPVPPRRFTYIDAVEGLHTGQTASYTYTVASSAIPLRIILVWTDYPGSLISAVNLVNDLDLEVTGPVTASISTGTGRGPDRLNNVEGVIIQTPAAGTYRVTVRARNVPFGPQPYALVVSGHLAEPTMPPTLSLTHVPKFGVAGSHITVSWQISGGSAITETSLLWDTVSHAADRAYAYVITLPGTTARSYTASFTLPNSGTVYLTVCAWVDGQHYCSDAEHAINVVTAVQRIFLPVILTYPAPQPSPTPQPTTTPVIAKQLIQNGGFENNAPQSPPWHQYDRADPRGLLVSDFWPHNGMWSAWLGGVYSDYQELYQTMTVPSGATYATLVFYWYMNSEDDLEQPHDILSVRLLNAAGELLTTVLQRDNTSTRNRWVATRYTWLGDFPYGGQTIRLSFDMVTDDRYNTNLYVDDISFFVSSGPIEGVEAGLTEQLRR